MVQEFHVLRCYSCQTFQVQQVKESKKWNCKMCGEKQSVIKEFGRGSGADCRRHVQKLNARRGEMLEEQDQKAWLPWEEVGSEAVEDCEDRPQDCDQQNVSSKVEEPSRWGKYLDKPVEEQGEEKAEEEEENVFMDRNQIHGNRNVRKRKRTCGWQNDGNRYHHGEEDTMAAPNSWRTAKPAEKNRYSGSFTPVEKTPNPQPPSCRPVSRNTRSPSTDLDSSKPPLTTAPNRLNAVTSSHPRSSSTTTVSKASKWAQFLTAPSPQDEEEGEGESCRMNRDEAGKIESHVNPFHPQNEDRVTLSYEQPSCGDISAVGGLGSVCFKKSDGITFSRLKSTLSHCGFGEETNSKRDPTHMSSRLECTEPICEQPQPTKRPCPSLPVGSLFNTGEDFDDTFEFDDTF